MINHHVEDYIREARMTAEKLGSSFKPLARRGPAGQGGVGLRRGRCDPRRLHVGEALDWWRVESLERPRLLRLRAEMTLPGRVWRELEVTPSLEGGAVYRQRAVFGGMVRNITGAAAVHVTP